MQASAQITDFHDKEKEEWRREKWLKDDRRWQEGRGILNETALFPFLSNGGHHEIRTRGFNDWGLC